MSSRYYIHFAELVILYKALVRAGVEIHPEERAAYLLLARESIESRKRKRESIHPACWEALTTELASFDDSLAVFVPLKPAAPQPGVASQTLQQRGQPLVQAIGEMGAMLAALLSTETRASSPSPRRT